MMRPPANTGNSPKPVTLKSEAGFLGNKWETAQPKKITQMIQGTILFTRPPAFEQN